MQTVLICDDEKDIVSALRIYLNAEGYNVIGCYNGKEAVEAVRKWDIQLVLLDVMMPVLDGIEAMAQIREFSNIPIILLTAKSEDTDKIAGLNVGADDYVTKPFNPVELMARVRSQLRRYLSLGSQVSDKQQLCVGGVLLDNSAKRVTVDGEEISLTPREFDILHFLMKNVGTVFSPREIYKKVWQEEPIGAENAIAVHIRHIREKIEINPAEPRYLKVVWGRGYKIENHGGARYE